MLRTYAPNDVRSFVSRAHVLATGGTPLPQDSPRPLLSPIAPCWRSPMWRSQAEAEGLTLLKADNKTGYFGVHHKPQASKSKPYQAQVSRGGKDVYLGSFATVP